MKKCLQCEQVYGDETNFCLSDGSTLVSVSDSFTSETPTVYSGAPLPTLYSNATPPKTFGDSPFVPPISYPNAPPEPKKSNTVLIALVVGFFALLIGGAVVGLVMYGLFSSGNRNVANVSNSADKSNKSNSAEQKSDNENLAQNLKEQQDKLARDKQKLEDERKALEDKKKQTPQPSQPPPNSRTATIIDPPTNIRLSPNGTVLCVVRRRTTVNILGSTGVTDNNGTWYYTDACGREGVIHSSQIRF
ncbi:MAG TPA: hypothetical protein VNB22_01800 [Pyrinomonadaceae bacterium]|nr:hypothetical protein [Pyrinomonadaceae bacterium]